MGDHHNAVQKEADEAHLLFHTLFRVPRLYHILVALNEFMVLSRRLCVDEDFFAWLFYSRYSHLMRIIRLIFLVVLSAQYMACGCHIVTRDDPDAPNATPPGASTFERYVSDVHYSILLIQGQGDSNRTTLNQNIYSIFAVLLRSVILTIVFGNVAMLVSNFNANSTNYQRKMEVVFCNNEQNATPTRITRAYPPVLRSLVAGVRISGWWHY
uniref:Ion transport domain-containing protein n=1 Tax=Globisporangium ultimum (strain ATCC 200006 / CBS 805.95 / DAOM BR144) TaxID=431595 RepID=K3WXR1_GLOUD